jgi:hypothetical protein
MSGERAWSSEDTEPFSFKVVFTVFHGIVIGLGIRNKALKLNIRLEAEAYWLRCGRVAPCSNINFNCGIRVQWFQTFFGFGIDWNMWNHSNSR